jgi:hypothetical protein
LQPLAIPEKKWEVITMDFITGLPKTNKKHDSIMVLVDKLTKAANFVPVKTTHTMANCLRKISLRTGRSPQRDRILTLRQKVIIIVTDFLLDLGGLVCEEEGEKKYLLLVFVPARSELSSNLSLLDKPCRQTKYDHFLLYQD